MGFPGGASGKEPTYQCRIHAFELWCWRRLLRAPWTVRRSNLSILKEIIPEYSLEGLMLKLKLQYFGHLMRRTDSLEKTLMLGKIEGGRRTGATEDEMVGWHHWLDGNEFEQAPGIGDGQGSLVCCSPWGHKESDMTEQLNWTEPMKETWEMQVWSGRSSGGGNGNPLQYSCLENPMDRGAWWATVHEVTKSRTRLKQCSTHALTHDAQGVNSLFRSLVHHRDKTAGS